MRRTVTAAALSAALLATAPFGPWDPLRALLAALFGGAPAASSPGWPEKEGCGMDPNGQCKAAPRATSEEGCGMDPSGRCPAAAQPQSDAGCGMDPNGHCLPGS